MVSLTRRGEWGVLALVSGRVLKFKGSTSAEIGRPLSYTTACLILRDCRTFPSYQVSDPDLGWTAFSTFCPTARHGIGQAASLPLDTYCSCGRRTHQATSTCLPPR